MHIAIDVRPLQLDAYKERGIGIHLRSWLEAAQLLETEHRFSLLFDSQLPAPRIHVASSQWQLQAFELPFSPPYRSPTTLHLDADEEFVFDSALEAFLSGMKIDVFHESYTFAWETFVARRLYKVHFSAIFYDLIPLVFKEEYLEYLGGKGKDSFAQRLGAAVYAQRLQTLSQASRDDLVKFTGVSPDMIDVVYGGVDEAFVPLGPKQIETEIAGLGVTPPYLFSVSGFHHTKNLRGLLESYALLPASIRQQFQLVVRCPLSAQDESLVNEWINELGLPTGVHFLREVTQSQLVALYNGATLVVHPTLYEGLGLPVLEAMRCGTPVVTSDQSSLPEIAGGAAELVDPYRPAEIAEGIRKVLKSTSLQSEMRELGSKNAEKYTWRRVAKKMIESLQKAADSELHTLQRVFPCTWTRYRERRLRLAFWSPFNPRPSGVSDYSELLLAELGKAADVDVFVDGYQLSNTPLFDSFPTFDGRSYAYLMQDNPYDMTIYQVGNNPLHRYMYRPMRKWPGIITLHDIFIYHFIHAAITLGESAEKFWDEVAYCEGTALAHQARIDYFKGQLDDYLLSLNKRLVVESKGVVVHSEWGRERVVAYDGAAPVRVIPFGLVDLPDDHGRFGGIIRRLLRLPENGFVFGVFGNLHRVKRLPVVISAFQRIRKRYPEAVLFIMGPVDVSAANAIEPFQLGPEAARQQGIHLYLTYASYDLMLMAMQAVDVGINLRYPTAGETSGTLSMLLGQRKPTIVSDVGSFSEYPDVCCPKVPIDKTEEDTLVHCMQTFLQNKKYYRQAVRVADDFARERTWTRCAQQYLEFVEDLLSGRSR